MARNEIIRPLNRYAHVDAIRAFAVLLVVLSHAGLTKVPGDTGVTYFFVVSGFVITHVLISERIREGGFSIGQFYLKRAVKLGPPLLVILVIPTLIASIWISINTFQFASQVLFFYNWVQINVGESHVTVLPGSTVVWSLAIEEQFYIVFAAIWLALSGRKNWPRYTLWLAIAAILYGTITRVVLANADATSDRLYRGTDSRLDAIALGILIAVLWYFYSQGLVKWLAAAGRDWALIVGVALFVASFAPLGEWYESTFRHSIHAVSACLLILYGMFEGTSRIRIHFNRVVTIRVVNVIGLASYSIYLVHLELFALFAPLTETWSLLARVGAFVAIGLTAGIAIYYTIEVPALRLRKRLQKPGTSG